MALLSSACFNRLFRVYYNCHVASISPSSAFTLFPLLLDSELTPMPQYRKPFRAVFIPFMFPVNPNSNIMVKTLPLGESSYLQCCSWDQNSSGLVTIRLDSQFCPFICMRVGHQIYSVMGGKCTDAVIISSAILAMRLGPPITCAANQDHIVLT